MEKIKYALPPIVHDDSKVLLLGSMPGEKSIALQQYYGNKGNQFWKILFAVFEEPFSTDYEERQSLLRKHKIAIWNTLASCEREGSRDDKIKNVTVNDFEAFFELYPTITHVFFESISAAKFYAKYAYESPHITYMTLPSTSGLYSIISFDKKLEQWLRIKEAL